MTTTKAEAAQTLAEAARLMRTRAQHCAGSAVGWWQKAGLVDHFEDLLSGEVMHPREEAEADAAHIASWHPIVALAVADWLDSVAHSYRLMPHAPVTGMALDVARAYLAPAANAD